jgi:uncharacterized protein (TIGR00255 family)
MNGAVYSMTGFATATLPTGLSIDIRSVNSRFLDLSFKLPDSYRYLEAKLRECVTASVRRGKCEVRINQSSTNNHKLPVFDAALLAQVLALQASIQSAAPKAEALSVADLIGLASCKDGADTAAAVAPTEADIVPLMQKALQDFNQARSLEGGKLALLMRGQIAALQTLRDAVLPLVPALIEQQRQRFLQKFEDALANANAFSKAGEITASVAHDRALAEVTAFAIRIDVTEELDRLGSHLVEIDHLLQNGSGKKGQELGKRLEFLIQELHREANTLGSKSATLETTRIAVDMKVLIEQLREQIQNIE